MQRVRRRNAGDRRKDKVTQIRALLGTATAADPNQSADDPAPPLTLREPCPECGAPMRIIETFRRREIPRSRAPPRNQTA
jgi:hypothetical protein